MKQKEKVYNRLYFDKKYDKIEYRMEENYVLFKVW